MLIILSGLIAGAAHVVAGPDHLAAVAPIAATDPKRAVRLGLQWGLGHGLGALALGLIGVFARDAVNIEAFSAWAEFLVGPMLICVGAWGLYQARGVTLHVHNHEHDGTEHRHAHVHAPGAHEASTHTEHSHAVLWVGALHGAAGTGHLLAVVPALSLQRAEAVVYLLAYFVAAVGSMGLFGALVGSVARSARPAALTWIMRTTATAAIVIGFVWLKQAWPA